MARPRRRRLARGFYNRHPLELAPELLNKVLVHGDRSGRIVEVEAYCGVDDPASHAFRGPTPRNEVMFGPAGHLYVYFSYGMHWCANVVAADVGVAGAALIRAVEPLTGLDEMRLHRPAARRDVDIANGPAKTCQAMGIDGSFDGADLVTADRAVFLVDDGTPPPSVPTTGPRVGISVAVNEPWRFSVPAAPHRSRPIPTP